MSAFDFASNTFDFLADRNTLANRKIADYALAQGAADMALGGIGSIVPGMALPTLVAAMTMQLPVYRALVRDLGRIYDAPPNKLHSGLVLGGTAAGAAGLYAADVAEEFASQFLMEVAPGILIECGLGIFVASLPGLGIAFGMGLDLAVAATMTWRVGTMASIFYQNGHQWVKSRKNTYKIAKRLTGRISPAIEKRVDLDAIHKSVHEIDEKLLKCGLIFLRKAWRDKPIPSESQMRECLEKNGYPDTVSNELIRRYLRERA